MKQINIIGLIALLSMLLIGCKNNKRVIPEQEEKEVHMFALPIQFDLSYPPVEKDFITPHADRDSIFMNTSLFGDDIRIARLPGKGNFSPVLIYYSGQPSQVRIDACTLDVNGQIMDKMTVYSSESIKGDSLIIFQTFEITEDYHFIVSKHLNDVLIEQLNYIIDEKGVFTEVRDGETAAVAYESLDGIHYTVDSFIWDYDHKGTLYRKNQNISYYKIDSQGTIVKENK